VRKRLLEDPDFAALSERVLKKTPEGSALRHKWKALTDPEPSQQRPALIAAHVQECLEGKGQWHDVRGKLKVDRKGIATALDAMAGNPALFEQTVLAWGRQHAPGPDDPDFDTSLKMLKDALGPASLFKVHEKELIPGFTETDQAQASFAMALGHQVERAELDHRHRELLGQLARIHPNHAFTASEVQEWTDALDRGGAPADKIRALLAANGIDEGGIAQLRAYGKGLRENETARRAALAVAALLSGDAVEAMEAMADPAHAAKRAALEARAQDQTLSLAERLVAEDDLKGLDDPEGPPERSREALRDAIEARLPGGLTLEEAMGRFGETSSTKGRWWGLRVNRGRWLKQVLQTGELEEHQKIFMALQGVGDDPAAVLQALSTRSPGQIATIRRKFREEFGENLDQRLQDDLGGRSKLLVELAMRGDPKVLFDPKAPPSDATAAKDAAELRLQTHLAAVEGQYDFERGGGVLKSVVKGAVGGWESVQAGLGLREDAGEHLDALQAQVRTFVKENHRRLVEQRDPAAWAELERLLAFHEAGVTEYRTTRKKASGAATRLIGRAGFGLGMAFDVGWLDRAFKAATKLGLGAAKVGASGALEGGLSGEEWFGKAAGFGLGVGLKDTGKDLFGEVWDSFDPATKEAALEAFEATHGGEAVDKLLEAAGKSALSAKAWREDQNLVTTAGTEALGEVAAEAPKLLVGAAVGQVKGAVLGEDEDKAHMDTEEAEFAAGSALVSDPAAAALKTPFEAEAATAGAAEARAEQAEEARLAALRVALLRQAMALGQVDPARARALYDETDPAVLQKLGMPPAQILAMALEDSETARQQAALHAPDVDERLAHHLLGRLATEGVGTHPPSASQIAAGIRALSEVPRPDLGTGAQAAFDGTVGHLARLAGDVVRRQREAASSPLDEAGSATLEHDTRRLAGALAAFRAYQQTLRSMEGLDENQRALAGAKCALAADTLAEILGEDVRTLLLAGELVPSLAPEADPKGTKKKLAKLVGAPPPEGTVARRGYDEGLARIQGDLALGILKPDDAVQALAAFRDYEQNLDAMQDAPIEEVMRLQAANERLVATLRHHGLSVLPPMPVEPRHV